MKNRVERIKAAIRVAFGIGLLIGSIGGGILGYLIGTGNLYIELPEQQELCYPVKCEHYERELIGGAMVYEKNYCCGAHGHDCPTY